LCPGIIYRQKLFLRIKLNLIILLAAPSLFSAGKKPALSRPNPVFPYIVHSDASVPAGLFGIAFRIQLYKLGDFAPVKRKNSNFYQTIKAAVKKMRLRHDLRNTAERMPGTARGPFPT